MFYLTFKKYLILSFGFKWGGGGVIPKYQYATNFAMYLEYFKCIWYNGFFKKLKKET